MYCSVDNSLSLGPLSSNVVQVFALLDVNKDGECVVTDQAPKVQILMVGARVGIDNENDAVRRFLEQQNFTEPMVGNE